jgi:phytoene dehydrogenase-like protein
VKVPLLVLGGGLSGLAAAIRASRFLPEVLLLEKHSRLGGLNSYFYRNKHLFETGLHAITNYAAPGDKQAPLNRLLRQLKLRRDQFSFCQQLESEIVFSNVARLSFSNDSRLLIDGIHTNFPKTSERFDTLLKFVEEYDPFKLVPFISARSVVSEILQDHLLVEMLFCPLMFYGSCREHDMDLGQFVIMFRSIFLEGLFRPAGTMRDIIELLQSHLVGLGGTIRTLCPVRKILVKHERIIGVQTADDQIIECDLCVSTIGYQETLALLDDQPIPPRESTSRLTFVETIYQSKLSERPELSPKTIIFFNNREKFQYRCPDEPVDFASGVICFPNHFHDLPPRPLQEVRTTHLANYQLWNSFAANPTTYNAEKQLVARRSCQTVANLLGTFSEDIVYENTFTPVTIERYTAKQGGAVYGSPDKIADGRTTYKNLFLAGTDQGFLGIIGSMLSGISIVNRHILPQS